MGNRPQGSSRGSSAMFGPGSKGSMKTVAKVAAGKVDSGSGKKK